MIIIPRLLRDRQVVGIVDLFFGDNGKGKIDDELAALVDEEGKLFFEIDYRPGGGPNTGHSTVVDGKKRVFHLIPSGSIVEGMTSVLGRAQAFDCRIFFQELEMVQEVNPRAKILVDYGAHVIIPYHTALDRLREATMGDSKIGTTGRGVGPCMETKASRFGYVTVGMLNDKPRLKEQIEKAKQRIQPELSDITSRLMRRGVDFRTILSEPKFTKSRFDIGDYNSVADFFDDRGEIHSDMMLQYCLHYGAHLGDLVTDAVTFVKGEAKEGKRILVEGTQGYFLDLTHGDYPYVTAGLTTRSGLEHDAGIYFDLVVNVTKPYATRVGNGHFPSEITGKEADILREAGGEYGSTTGRPRRVGHLDAVALRYALDDNLGSDEYRIVALTKLDVLKGFRPKITVGYEVNGRPKKEIHDLRELSHVSGCCNIPLDGEIEDIRGLTRFDDLPGNARKFVDLVEKLVECYVMFAGTGPERGQFIMRDF